MNESLLICVAYHHRDDRLQYLKQVVNNFLENYKVELFIYVQSNVRDFGAFDDKKVHWMFCDGLAHPFHLTFMHRAAMYHHLNQFDNFLYVEDDLFLPFENYLAYLDKFDSLWKNNFVPSFVRIEKLDGKEFVTDVIKQHSYFNWLSVDNKFYTSFPFPENYTGFWLLPAHALKETLRRDFVRLSDSRETAASYPTWELKKIGLVQVYMQEGRWVIHPSCYSYHLPNTYVTGNTLGLASIEVGDILI